MNSSGDVEGTVDNSLPSKKRGNKVIIALGKHPQVQPLCMWKDYLKNIDNSDWVAPVDFFRHAPFSASWKTLAVQNLIIELPNPMCSSKRPVNWVGTIYGYAGYKALVVFYPMSASPDVPEHAHVSTWIPFCSSIPKPLGYSITENILLHPPTENPVAASLLGPMVGRMFNELLFKKDAQFESVKLDHERLVNEELARCASRFHPHEVVEVVDKNDISEYRLAVVQKIIGDRVSISYLKETKTDQGFVMSQNSPHIHKLGWCEAVGYPLRDADPEKMLNLASPSLDDLLDIPSGICMQKEMVFEMRHPCFPYKICLGYCVKVLEHGYFLAATDWTREDTTEIVLHLTSDYILPIGFCEKNDIAFEAPMDAFPNHGQHSINSSGKFSWEKYLHKKKLKAFDFKTTIPKGINKFVKGSKLEVVKLHNPVLLRPATVTKVAGRLIQIHLDGKPENEKSSYQWMSCDSTNIYPVGYAELVWHGTKGKPDAPTRSGNV